MLHLIFTAFLGVAQLASAQRTADYDVGLACRYVEYCLVSYCIGLGGHGVPTWKCPACTKYFPNVDPDNVVVFKTGFTDYDIHAYVAYNPDVPEIIVAFEGTEPLSLRLPVLGRPPAGVRPGFCLPSCFKRAFACSSASCSFVCPAFPNLFSSKSSAPASKSPPPSPPPPSFARGSRSPRSVLGRL